MADNDDSTDASPSSGKKSISDISPIERTTCVCFIITSFFIKFGGLEKKCGFDFDLVDRNREKRHENPLHRKSELNFKVGF